MGQKTNPIGNRLGIIRGWDSNWYGGNDYGDKIAEYYKIRKYIHARLSKASVSKVIIERTLKLVTVTITTARPGIIIGKGGQEVDKLKEELKKMEIADKNAKKKYVPKIETGPQFKHEAQHTIDRKFKRLLWLMKKDGMVDLLEVTGLK